MQDLSYRYTMGDSTSLPIEKANELLKSAVFCIDLHLKSSGHSLLDFAPFESGIVSKLFAYGRCEALRQVALGKELFENVIENILPVGQQCYLDTLHAIGDFFKLYDVHFMAHEIPCAIDYPLCHPMPELYGIAYINEYLRRLHLENTFCRRFQSDLIRRMLVCHWPDYQLALINLCDPIFINAMGLCLLNKDVFMLNLAEQDKTDLAALLCCWSQQEAAMRIDDALHRLLDTLDMADDFAVEYFGASANDLLVRMSALIDWDGFYNLFVTIDGVSNAISFD